MERAQWERPVDGGAISARGRLEAAKAQVEVQLAQMRVRGAVEEFIPNPDVLEEGKVIVAHFLCPCRRRRRPAHRLVVSYGACALLFSVHLPRESPI